MPQKGLDGYKATAYYHEVGFDDAKRKERWLDLSIVIKTDSDLHPIGRDRYDPGLISSGKEGEKCDETDDACDGSSGNDGISSRQKYKQDTVSQRAHCKHAC